MNTLERTLIEKAGFALGWENTPERVAMYFDRHAFSYIMDTFPIVNRKDETKHGHYRTKDTILQIYDALGEAMTKGQPYQTRLDPPPAAPECRHPKKNVGILAFGSLIGDPGTEIGPKITMRIKYQTPFGIEYGRFSQSRGGAPTLVPHEKGAPVSAEILVLDDAVTEDEAHDMLWRCEPRRIGSGENYTKGNSPNSVLAASITDSPRVETVFRTDFNPSGKIPNPTAFDLAKSAIESVKKAEQGKDGITYLMHAMGSGVDTRLTQTYHDAILSQTNSNSLAEACEVAKKSHPLQAHPK